MSVGVSQRRCKGEEILISNPFLLSDELFTFFWGEGGFMAEVFFFPLNCQQREYMCIL